jgi:glycyl-tRNA synthetase
VGLTRSVLVVLCDAYDEDVADGEPRSVLRFHPLLAPITVGVFPLVKKDGLSEIALEVEEELREHYTVFYDQSGAIGRRYRRQDEAGTPYCVTVDYQTKDDQTVTIRERDSMAQVRLKRNELVGWIRGAIAAYKRVGA